MDDVVTARADYSKLDDANSAVRSSIEQHCCACAAHKGRHNRQGWEVAYVRGGKLVSVRAKNCVLACYNGMIPYICRSFRPSKRSARLSREGPLVYTHVALRNWAAFHKLGVHHIVAPGGYHTLHRA